MSVHVCACLRVFLSLCVCVCVCVSLSLSLSLSLSVCVCVCVCVNCTISTLSALEIWVPILLLIFKALNKEWNSESLNSVHTVVKNIHKIYV
jgi:hypothetical protein